MSARPVAAVAAETEATRARRRALIEVDYEELPAVLDPGGRRSRPAPRSSTRSSASYFKVFAAGSDGNLCSRTEFARATSTRLAPNAT